MQLASWAHPFPGSGWGQRHGAQMDLALTLAAQMFTNPQTRCPQQWEDVRGSPVAQRVSPSHGRGPSGDIQLFVSPSLTRTV